MKVFHILCMVLMIAMMQHTCLADEQIEITYGDGWTHYNYTDGTQAHKLAPSNYLRWDGDWRSKTEMNMSSGDWPYMVDEFETYYLVTRSDDTLILSKTYRTYDFQPYKIGVQLILTPVQLNGMSTYHNVGGTDYWYITIPQSLKQNSKHLNWDNKLPNIRNNTLVDYTDEIGESYTAYGTISQSNFGYRTVSGELRFYYNQVARNFGISSTEIIFDFNSYVINGSSGWQNTSCDNTTEDLGDHYIKIGIFADNFDDNDLTGWTTVGGTHTASNGVYNQTTAIVEWMKGRPTTYSYPSSAVILAKVNVTDGGTYLDSCLGFSDSTFDSSTGIYAGYRNHVGTWDLRSNGIWDDSDSSGRTLNVWTTIKLYNKSNSYNYSSSYDSVIMNTTVSPTGDSYPFLLGSSVMTQYWDDVRIVPLDSNDDIIITGNVTHWHDAGAGYQTASFVVNMTTPANTNYTGWYADNGSSFTQIGGTYTGNQTLSISGTKYQNTDLQIIMNGNSTATPEEIEVIFVTEASSTPTPTPTPALTPPVSPAHYDELGLPLILYILLISMLYLLIAFRIRAATIELSLIYLIFAFIFLLFQTVTMSVNYIYLTLFLLLFMISITGITLKQGAD